MASTFQQLLERRARLWWDAPRPGERTFRDAAHRLRERRTRRSRYDPDEVWRCCAAWPWTLVDKWNGNEYAARHGCTVPEPYRRVGSWSRLPAESLPRDCVVRAVRGTQQRGVFVVRGGEAIDRDGPVTAAELGRRLEPWRRHGRPVPLLVEELVRAEDGTCAPPLELKCHTFAGTVAAIDVQERAGLKPAGRRYYTPGWEPFEDEMEVGLPFLEVRPEPPAGFAAMLAQASAIGGAVGTYLRIDFFAAAGGIVFNEFSTLPRRGEFYTAYCQELFGALWVQHCGDAV